MACLVYDEEHNRLKWTGTERELKLFVDSLTSDVDGWKNGNWEYDTMHNMLSYKTAKIVLKWYSSTKTVLIQGKEHAELKSLLYKQAKAPSGEISVNFPEDAGNKMATTASKSI